MIIDNGLPRLDGFAVARRLIICQRNPLSHRGNFCSLE